ncbi:hypothetical protein HA152_07620 [Prochlorococcus marinus XMU1412]|uniref:lasso peptide biosynthesis protein n=1 Tax=Prochlorococcus marinus TaxID=1219 RepID=UPI001ADAD01D|nr:lasso peptide biosynthesis protein [Prochlorococcus marinus]MBO8240570.1 hypothetical protein [Prochlorococcus marinus XMU1412]
MKLLRKNCINKFSFRLKDKKIFLIKKKTREFCEKKSFFSSCLSKAISIKFIFDILNINNKLYFGISKHSNGKKVAHAWLVDPKAGKSITPGFYKDKGLTVYKF